jgi:hypothetical protein
VQRVHPEFEGWTGSETPAEQGWFLNWIHADETGGEHDPGRAGFRDAELDLPPAPPRFYPPKETPTVTDTILPEYDDIAPITAPPAHSPFRDCAIDEVDFIDPNSPFWPGAVRRRFGLESPRGLRLDSELCPSRHLGGPDKQRWLDSVADRLEAAGYHSLHYAPIEELPALTSYVPPQG